MSNVEIAAATGLTVRQVERFSSRDTWAGVDGWLISAWREACGVTMATEADQMKYLRKTLLKSKRPLHHTMKLSRKMFRVLTR